MAAAIGVVERALPGIGAPPPSATLTRSGLIAAATSPTPPLGVAESRAPYFVPSRPCSAPCCWHCR
jgi:hypothetical protein